MNRIKQLIKEKGYTMEGFAQKLGITRQSFTNTLQSPSYPSLERIAKALDVELWELFTSWEEIKHKKVNSGGDTEALRCPACGAKLVHKVTVTHTVTLTTDETQN